MHDQLVDKDSAVLNLSNEVAVGISQANHETICMFEQVDRDILPVWHAVRTLCKDALSESFPGI